MNQKLFHKDFTMVVLGQIISLFGNAIIRFALPLYLLNVTGSASLYGLASALPFVPLIILTPIGGMIADRVNKRNIMVILDFSTAGIILGYLLLEGNVNLVVLLIITMMILYAIQGIYQPAVQASVPLLASEDKLLPANAMINQVGALANLIGPVAGGVLFGIGGLTPILIIGVICFFLSAVMELFIKIPYVKQKKEEHIRSMVQSDFRESMNFIKKEQPVIKNGIVIICGVNLFLSALLIVGMPVLVTQYLNLSNQLFGYSQGILFAGGLAGGILTGVFAGKLKIQESPKLLFASALLLIPMGVSLLLPISPFVVYLILTACCFGIMLCATMFSIQTLSFVQRVTPDHMIGKVISWVMAISMCAQPLGLAIYGNLFELMKETPAVVVLGGAVCSTIIAIAGKKVFEHVK